MSDSEQKLLQTTQFCTKCQKILSKDEIALHKKLFNRGAESFCCIECNAAYFGVTVKRLEEKIKQFREMGCTLFEPLEDHL